MAERSAPEVAAEGPYQSLYRRFRPQRFAEVRGQDHVTRALRNAVRDGRVAHAYLFSGPRGTGKTSTARILAKALNCAAPEDGEPCGTCDSCAAIAAGHSFDVHELDAASNNGVDSMRDLVARAALTSPGKWKVYVVDEVHMLSASASNALLKTLEEPPDHVVFILATTDPKKVLATIRSRTQHFEFRLLPEEVLEPLLADVARRAALELPEGALSLAIRKARGSARDALSALDQVAASGVTDDGEQAVVEIVAALANQDTAGALASLDAALRASGDPQQLAVDLVERLRAGFLALVAPRRAGVHLDAAVLAEAQRLGTARCVRALELIGTAIVAMRDAPEPRVTLEVALIRLTHPEADDSVAALAERLARVEERVAHLAPVEAGPPPRRAADSAPAAWRSEAPAGARLALGAYRRPGGPAAGPPQAAPPAAEEPAAPEREATPQGAGDCPERDALVAAWGDHILAALRPKVKAVYLAGRFVGTEGPDALFALPNEAHLLHAEPLRAEVASALSAHFGRPIGLRLVVDGAPRQRAPEDSLEAGVEDESNPDPDDDLAPAGSAPEPTGLTVAADRLLKAFPGAEEV
ncbi:MAG TPA: DNA polymerase III subunit gamma/tau [Acidimicrobiales bacterium]|nr:DNA polymerase III subunit gamma/tau [Acidimicrobiales bacterium]